MFGSLLSVILAAVAVGMLILVHELGHFLAARAVGVRVEVFSIGFWKKLFSFRRGDTEYKISLIPLGGYVKLAGESPDEATGEPDELWSKTPGQRSLVFVAGVTMNIILAAVGFMIAFAIGVPFTVAEIGELEKSMPAWEAGMRRGDVITRVNGVKDPDFQDVTRQVALKGLETVPFTVERGDETLEFEITPEYHERTGIRRIGFRPPYQPIVSGLTSTDKEIPEGPASRAGVQVGDRIVAIDGREVERAEDVQRALRNKSSDEVEVVVERKGERLKFDITTEPTPEPKLGISGVGSTIEALQGDGMAQRIGLRTGDTIRAVNGEPVRSLIEAEELIENNYGEVEIEVEDDEGGRSVRTDIPNRDVLDDFIFSMECDQSNELQWVMKEGPAWEAGMRPGDRITEIDGTVTPDWEGVLEANASGGKDKRQITWVRDGEKMSATVVPERNLRDGRGHLGVILDRPRQTIRQLPITKAVSQGFYKTYASIVDILLTIRGFASREVSPKNVGGVVLIAYSSYRAAQQGLGKLFYLMAVISGALAFLNILPIPVLDGGHLLFEGIGKLKGKPVSMRARAISQTIGMILLLALVVFAIRNDIIRLFDLF